jgi:hypothetical protein
MLSQRLEMSDRKFFLQAVQGIGGLGAFQLLLWATASNVFPTDLLKVLIGLNQLLFVTLIAWYATRLQYDRRWSIAFGAFSLVPVLGFLPAALLYWKGSVTPEGANVTSVVQTKR